MGVTIQGGGLSYGSNCVLAAHPGAAAKGPWSVGSGLAWRSLPGARLLAARGSQALLRMGGGQWLAPGTSQAEWPMRGPGWGSSCPGLAGENRGFRKRGAGQDPWVLGGVSVRPATGEGSEGGTSRRTAGGLGGQFKDD